MLCLWYISVHAYLQEGGSYQQRILVEYLKGIQSRAEEIVQALQGKTQWYVFTRYDKNIQNSIFL